ncbi:MAG: PTS sugar transporter subunit IIA [Lysobacteraceae bacterium]
MHLIDLLTPAQVRAGVAVASKKRLLELCASLLSAPAANLALERPIFDSLCARERLGSTSLGHGVAIPHGRIEGLAAPSGAFLRLSDPLPFDAADGEPVDLVFALVVPEHYTQQHLTLLSHLAEMFSDSACRQRLRQASDDQALFAALSEWQIVNAAA